MVKAKLPGISTVVAFCNIFFAAVQAVIPRMAVVTSVIVVGVVAKKRVGFDVNIKGVHNGQGTRGGLTGVGYGLSISTEPQGFHPFTPRNAGCTTPRIIIRFSVLLTIRRRYMSFANIPIIRL